MLAPDEPQYLELEFEKRTGIAIDGKSGKPAEIIRTLNTIAGKHGIGRVDLVENRFVGMKSRGVYETPVEPFYCTGTASRNPDHGSGSDAFAGFLNSTLC